MEKYYKTESHIFTKDDKYYYYNVMSGNLYRVDDITCDILQQCDGKTLEEIFQNSKNNNDMGIDEYREILDELLEANMVSYSKDESAVSKFKESGMPTENYPVSNIALHVSHDCNLRCTYCYGDGGSYGGARINMPKEIAFKAIDTLINYSGMSNELSVTFFGGEPLINFGLIKEVTQYCRQKEVETGKKISLGMTTNGTLLDNDEILNYLDENKISVSISIDGPKEVHDKYRVFEDGSGSFDQMMKGVSRLIERRDGKVTARITLGQDNLGLYEIGKEIAALGFKKVNVALASGDDTSDFSIKQNNLEIIKEEYAKAAEECLACLKNDKPFTALNMFYLHIQNMHQKKITLYNCGAGRSYISITPDGNMYVCHRFAGDEKYNIGHVETGLNSEVQKETMALHVENRSKCEKCWCRYLCGGGCYYNCAHNKVESEDSTEIGCDALRKYFELCIMIYDEMLETDKNFWDKHFNIYNEKMMQSRLEREA